MTEQDELQRKRESESDARSAGVLAKRRGLSMQKTHETVLLLVDSAVFQSPSERIGFSPQ